MLMLSKVPSTREKQVRAIDRACERVGVSRYAKQVLAVLERSQSPSGALARFLWEKGTRVDYLGCVTAARTIIDAIGE